MSLLASDNPLTPSQGAGAPTSSAFSALWAALNAHAVPLLVCAALWALCHPYPGIAGDSRIYIARIMADLDPHGVGRDMMFVNDGQFGFSLFPILGRGLVANFGPAIAAEIISALAGIAWFAAALALAARLASGRAVWLILIFVCVLPHTYAYQIFLPAETMAVPRPFAEAAVLASFSALIARRPLVAAAFIFLAFLMHPLMALPGSAVFAVMYLRDWRAIAAAATVAGLCIVSGVAGIPLFDRLFVKIDAEWLDLLLQLNPYLFPTHWTSTDYALLAVQTATMAIAASLLAGTVRRLFVAALIVGVGGVLVAILFGDILRSLIAIQVQLWRSIWLMAVLAQFGYAVCVWRLWTHERRGARAHIALALLTLGWFCMPDLAFASLVAALALVVHFGPWQMRIASRYVALVWAATAVLVLCSYAGLVAVLWRFLAHMPEGAALGTLYALRLNIEALPICALAALWLFAGPAWRWPRRFAAAGAAAAAILAALAWRSVPPAPDDLQTLRRPAEFAAILDSHPGEVFWVDGKSEAWFVLGRPQWGSMQQSASVVFSRKLAMLWRDRAQMLLDIGLMPANAFTPWKPVEDSAILKVTRAALAHVCIRDDAPVAVIFPLEKGAALPAGIPGSVWTPPHPHFVMDANDDMIWHEIDRYVAVPCAAISGEKDHGAS
jgi:hypothetical protein